MFHVKPNSPHIASGAIIQALTECQVTVSAAQAELLARHAELVLEANKYLNLTRITEPEEVLHLHIVDSLAFLHLVRPLSGAVVDIGSGAGYPGIPLAILGHEVLLCESVQKKAKFLETVVGDLELDAEVTPQRAEDLAKDCRATFSAVVARAVSALPSLLELASPLLQIGGRLIALKGSPESSELDQAERVARMLGFRCEVDEKYQLPRGEHRRVLVYGKVREPRIALPRRPGSAQRHPLG